MKTVCLLLLFSGLAAAQDLYVYSDIQIDDQSGNVTADFSSSTDYNTEYYYDLFVQGWLYFQQDGSQQQNIVCSNWASVGNESYVSSSCSTNLGSATGNLSLLSQHQLWTVYYVYQLEGNCYECDYWDDYYGYSFIADPDYGDDTYIYAPDYEEPIAVQTAIAAQILRQARKGGCVYPTSENTYTWAWNAYWPYVGQFLQTLNGGNFDGRYISEVFSGGASDQCWRPGNHGPVSNPIEGTWYVSDIVGTNSSGYPQYQFTESNAYGYDSLGFLGTLGNEILYDYVNDLRPSGGTCSVSFNQNMLMYCAGDSGPSQYYLTGNPLDLYIDATYSAASLTSSRSGVSQARAYP